MDTITICSHCRSVMVEHRDGFYFHCRHCDTTHRMIDCRICIASLPADVRPQRP